MFFNFWENDGIYENFNKAYHIKYVVVSLKMKSEL